MLIVTSFCNRAFERYLQQPLKTVGGLLAVSDALYLSRVYKKDKRSADKIANTVEGFHKTVLRYALARNTKRVKQELNNWDLFVKSNQAFLHEIGQEYEDSVKNKMGTPGFEFGTKLPRYGFAIQID